MLKQTLTPVTPGFLPAFQPFGWLAANPAYHGGALLCALKPRHSLLFTLLVLSVASKTQKRYFPRFRAKMRLRALYELLTALRHKKRPPKEPRPAGNREPLDCTPA